jgi:hypothetical protein
VLESDDWGLCAWSADDAAHRALSDAPAFRSAAGRVYGRSTLESAEDVGALIRVLLGFRGGDGLALVWQANTVMAAPDYERLAREGFALEAPPLLEWPDVPSRWRRPGLWEQVGEGIEAGAWWPELHGLHHLPAHAWLTALRRGDVDARRALAEQCPVCEAVEASGEFDPSEPGASRAHDLERAVARFAVLFGRPPGSLCPPDYRWDASLEAGARRLGVGTLQGVAERVGPWPRVRRLLQAWRWPQGAREPFPMPPRIAFEPRGEASPGARLGASRAHAAVRAAWRRGQPAVVSTHRNNYAHLDASWSEAGRAALGDLLARLCADGAVFLTDTEVRDLVRHGWSVRPLGTHGALLRRHGASDEILRFAAPAEVTGVEVRGGTADNARVGLEDGSVVARLGPGEVRLEWRRG